MEQFTLLSGDQTLKSSREPLNNALLTVRSLSAGDAFPTTNLSVGMLCYRTDQAKLYQLADESTQTWTDKLAANIAGNAASAASVAWTNVTAKPAVYPPEAHTHDYAGASSAGGAATSATKLATARTINGVPFDGTADITTDTGVMTVNGQSPDTNGNIPLNAICDASVNGQSLTFTFADNSTKTVTTQDTNTSNWSISPGESGYARDNTTGFTIQWGMKRDGTTTTVTTTFPRAFSSVYSVVITEISNKTRSNAVGGLSTTGFTAYLSAQDHIYWIATGIS